jgi:hypothetical protein
LFEAFQLAVGQAECERAGSHFGRLIEVEGWLLLG